MQSEYFARVRGIWSKNKVGPIAVVCAFLLPIGGVILHLGPTVTLLLAAAPLFIAILLTWPAHYEVWRAEHDLYRAEHESSKTERHERDAQLGEERQKREAAEVHNARPEIQGELSAFRASGNPGESRAGNVWRCYASAACKLHVCNLKAMKTTLKTLALDGSELDPPAEFSQVTFVRGAEKVLEQGIGVNCDILLTFTFKNHQWKQIGRVDLKPLKVYAVDSFGDKHLLSVAQGEHLPTP